MQLQNSITQAFERAEARAGRQSPNSSDEEFARDVSEEIDDLVDDLECLKQLLITADEKGVSRSEVKLMNVVLLQMLFYQFCFPKRCPFLVRANQIVFQVESEVLRLKSKIHYILDDLDEREQTIAYAEWEGHRQEAEKCRRTRSLTRRSDIVESMESMGMK